ncbi:versatile peroxidase VPL1 [Achaetomium macrosporum]|uniref:Peroxidase n=1 Tax=Achaetomium macrosporum TaxID=79813 RepID=A0AAN7C3K4_9PEZI|nr:versatile peroxidase VPL1 [Achaetomium macrosporum]
MEMKTSTLVTLVLGFLGSAGAYPGMHQALRELSSLAARQTSSIAATELIGDLATLPESALTHTGVAIKNILLGSGTAEDLSTTYTAPGPLGGSTCRNDTCCVWKYVADDMAQTFRDSSGECNELARQAIRLGFHDAGTWSKSGGGGGATGAIILAGDWTRKENRGLEDIATQMSLWYALYHPYGAGMADLIQMGATVAAVTCPLGPRVRSFVGRPDSFVSSPEGRLPNVTDSAEKLVALFADKTISLGELIALIGAHTVSRQRFVDPSKAGAPQDTSPGVWDVSFYTEAVSVPPPPGVFVFQSDLALSRYPGSQGFWSAFSNPANDQASWAVSYATAYVHLSVLGVEHINDLTECTGVLPLRNTLAP